MARSNTIHQLFIYLLLSVVCIPVAYASDGYIPVRNFSISDYSASAQNWEVVQDSFGRVYVANGYGMLCYDGSAWRLYQLPNYTSVRSLAFDGRTGRIYAGGSEEFGFFSSDSKSGLLRYTSLTHTAGRLHPDLTEIWNIFLLGDKVWFQGDYHIIMYDGKTAKTFDSKARITHSAKVEGSLYAALDNGRLMRVGEDGMKTLPGFDGLAGKKIVALLPALQRGKMLIGTSFDGLYIYDGHKTAPYACDINAFLKENQLFCSACSGDDYVFGTVNYGAVVKNFKTGRTEYLNKAVGLLNNTVLDADFDKLGNIWLSLDYGLSYAIYDTHVWNITGVSGPIGSGYASLVRGNNIYLGTNQGLYAASYPLSSTPSPEKFQQLLHGQIWSLSDFGSTIFVGSDAGAYASAGDRSFYKIEGLDGTTRVQPLAGNPSRAVALTYQGFHLLGNNSGRWTDLGRLEGYDDIAADFVQDKFGDIWLAHWRKGVFRLRYNEKTGNFGRSRLFDRSKGLSDDKNTSVTIFNDHVLVSTQNGYYYFNDKNEEMLPYGKVEEIFGTGKKGAFRALGDSVLAVIDSRGISIAVKGRDGRFMLDSASLRNIGDKLIPGYTSLYKLPDGKLLLSGYEGFWCVSPGKNAVGRQVLKPFVNTVTANGDSIVYRAPLVHGRTAGHKIEIPYNLNTLSFNFAYPDYSSPDAVEYSSFLEGYDREPSDFSTAKSREYTKIPNGKYTFCLKAKNLQTNVIEETRMEIVILPPWYRTIPAYILWFILGLLLAYGIYRVALWRIRLSQEALRKQREKEEVAEMIKVRHDLIKKDMESVVQRTESLEEGIRHREQRLSDASRNLMHKNEVLQEISEKLKQIDEMLSGGKANPSVQRKLEKIRQMIDYDLRNDQDWKQFSDNFDAAYSDFIKHLAALHPSLSVADMRLCCYIRMGLSSKEIAPRINISIKSVEMARYRVRKKIGLAPGDSLTGYLTSI